METIIKCSVDVESCYSSFGTIKKTIMDNKISNSNDYKYCDDKVENLENEDILHKYKYKLQDEDISLNFVEERSEMQCTDCKIIRDTRDKFLNHLNSRRHLKRVKLPKT